MATHIPGYYYDVDKNRYFKITSERPAPSRPQRPPSLDPPTGARVICKPPRSVYDFVSKHQFDLALQGQAVRTLRNRVLCDVHKTAFIRCPAARDEEYGAWAILDMSVISGCLAYICGTADRRLLEVVSLLNMGCDRVELSYELPATTSIPGTGLDAVSVDAKDLLLFLQDHHLCFVHRSNDPQASLNLGWSSVANVGVGWPVCAITWNHCGHTFSSHSAAVGLENGSVELVTLQNRAISGRYRSPVHSSVLSLSFASQGSSLLYAGHRSGHIQMWDIRSARPAITCCEDAMRSSVVALQPLADSTYLLSSAFNSKLSVWDLRLRQKVRHFREHVNDYRRCSMLLDHFQSTLIAAGSDCSGAVWSMASGQLQSVLAPLKTSELGLGYSCVPFLGMCEDPSSARGGAKVRDQHVEVPW
eukprot:Em0004g1348a